MARHLHILDSAYQWTFYFATLLDVIGRLGDVQDLLYFLDSEARQHGGRFKLLRAMLLHMNASIVLP